MSARCRFLALGAIGSAAREDEEEDKDTSCYSNPHNQNTGVKVQVKLKAYQMKLNKYLQLLREYPPDGSYYNLDIGFYSDTVMLPV